MPKDDEATTADNPKKIILFIPFSDSENNFDLYIMALNWRHKMHQAGKGKDIQIAVYLRNDELGEQDSFSGAIFNLDEKNCAGATLYVLAHGGGDEHLVFSGGPESDQHTMPIELVAQRLKEKGLTPKLAASLDTLKLYICEEGKANRALTNNFAIALGADYQHTELAYYNAKVSTPRELGKKAALHHVFSGTGESELAYMGRAKDYRQNTSVKEILASEPASTATPHIDVESFLDRNRAAKLSSAPTKAKAAGPVIEELDDEINFTPAVPSTLIIEEIDETAPKQTVKKTRVHSPLFFSRNLGLAAPKEQEKTERTPTETPRMKK